MGKLLQSNLLYPELDTYLVSFARWRLAVQTANLEHSHTKFNYINTKKCSRSHQPENKMMIKQLLITILLQLLGHQQQTTTLTNTIINRSSFSTVAEHWPATPKIPGLTPGQDNIF